LYPRRHEEGTTFGRRQGRAFPGCDLRLLYVTLQAPDALRLLRELGYDVPFIVVPGKIGEDAAVEIMKAGANDYLTKENVSRLCPAIERELRRRR
jgi:FixJ family two-component response regulator